VQQAEALRKSMLGMIDQSGPQNWAPFVFVGEPAKP